MTATNLVPSYVAKALNTDRKHQLSMLATLTVYVFTANKSGNPLDNLSGTLHKQAPHRSEKTWQNYVSAANSLAVHEATVARLEAAWSQTSDAAALPPVLVSFLSAELTAKGYTMSPEDMSNYAKGRPSIAVAAKNKKETEDKAKAEQAVIDAKANTPSLTQAEQDAQKAAAQKVIDDEAARVKAIADEKATQADAGETQTEALTGKTDAAPVIKPAIETLMVVRREVGGAMQIELGAEMTADEIASLMDTLQGVLDQMAPAPSDLPVIDPAMIPETAGA